MHHKICEFAVIRHQQRALGDSVEPADGVDTFLDVGDKLRDAFSAQLVVGGGDISSRLIEQDISQAALFPYTLTFDGHGIFFGVNAVPYLGGSAVHLDGARPYHILGLAP